MAGEAGMFTVQRTIGSVLCCKWGIPMQPNAANMCVKCLRSEVDITEGLLKRLVLFHCPDCEIYLQPPRTWVKLQLESKELLTFCLKRLQKNININKAKLVNAEFIWTEPHSKRVKVKVSVQKEVYHGAILEQSYLVEYVQQDHMCESCSKVTANPDQWVAVVQLRQHVSHRRTFFYLEQLILKHGAAARAVRIKQMDHGIDFYFTSRSHGNKFVEFIGKVSPIRSRSDKQLVSHDVKSSIYNYKYTFSVEISPICREDLICLPPKAARTLGNVGPIVICTKVTNSIALLDPHTLKFGFLDADQYWRTSFKSLLTSRQLVEYIVLDIEPVSSEVIVGGTKYVLADAKVARVSDFGKNDIMFNIKTRVSDFGKNDIMFNIKTHLGHLLSDFGKNVIMFNIKTHLGHLLKPGDLALGYDLYSANTNDMELDNYRGYVLEVVLIKKSYEEKRQKRRQKPRAWNLKSLVMEVDEKVNEDKIASEYEQFLKDNEENPELRFNISLYQNKDYQPSKMTSVADGEELPSVPFNELLAELDDLELRDDDDDGDDDDEEEDKMAE